MRCILHMVSLFICWISSSIYQSTCFYSYFSTLQPKQEIMPVMFENGTIENVLVEHKNFLSKKWQFWNISACEILPKSSYLGPETGKSTSEMVDQTDINSCDIMNLHPSDIHVVMALGDSITTAFVAENSTNIYNPLHLTEYLGVSYATGGSHDAISLLQLFDAYQLNGRRMHGASQGMKNIAYQMVFLGYPTKYHPKINGLNAAFTDGTSKDLIYQIQYLNETIRSIPEIDLEHDWKLLILYIGSNDLCISADDCAEPTKGNLGNIDFYEEKLREAIEVIRKTFPKTIVLLVDPMYFVDLDGWASKLEQCESLKWIRKYFCHCLLTEEGREHLKIKKSRMTLALQSIVRDYQLDTCYDTFKIRTSQYRMSPKWTDLGYESLKDNSADWLIPKHVDFGIIFYQFPTELFDLLHPGPYISELDCIHPSRFAHEAIAVSFWNNLFVPSSKRRIDIPKDLIYCPTQYDRIIMV